MMTERVKMRYVSCPSCGKQLFKVAGNCSVEITCVRCKKEIVGVVDEIYMKIFENCRGKEHDQEKASRYSTDMEALRQRITTAEKSNVVITYRKGTEYRKISP